MVKLQAHRGVSSHYPENTIAAFRAAHDEGYALIEFDFKYTSDGHLIALHDKTLNRTTRKADGEQFTEPTPADSLTLAEIRELDAGSWLAPEFAGEKIPTAEEVLDFAAEYSMEMKMDNCWERFPPEIQENLFSVIEKYSDRIRFGFTCANVDNIRRVAARFESCVIHYDGGDLSDERIDEVIDAAAGHPLVVWVCFDSPKTAWFRGTKASSEVCAHIKEKATLGVWILREKEEALTAAEWGADIIETNGQIKPSDML